jgi:hypothetical protein
MHHINLRKPVCIVTYRLSTDKHSTLSQIMPSLYLIRKHVNFEYLKLNFFITMIIV